MRGEVGVEVEEEETQKKSEQKPKRKKRMIFLNVSGANYFKVEV